MPKEYNPEKPFNEQTRATIEETWKNAGYHGMDIKWVGKRAAYQERLDPSSYKIDATDGIGTKALLHWLMYKYNNKSLKPAPRDAAAMVWDDIVELGAVPRRQQDHIIMQEENEKAIYDLTRGLADVCLEHKVVITGGETAICDTMRGFEMGITAVGVVKNDLGPRASQVKEGDTIIGLRSSGIHSNGLTFARKAYGLPVKVDKKLLKTRDIPNSGGYVADFIEAVSKSLGFSLENNDESLMKHLNAELPWGPTVGEELTIPTTIYCNDILELLKDGMTMVHGGVHITGGGWTKVKELDPSRKFDFRLNSFRQKPHEIFYHMLDQSKHLDTPLNDEAMYKNFNCGVGYMVAVDQKYERQAMEILKKHDPVPLGDVKRGKGRVKIASAFQSNSEKGEVVYG